MAFRTLPGDDVDSRVANTQRSRSKERWPLARRPCNELEPQRGSAVSCRAPSAVGRGELDPVPSEVDVVTLRQVQQKSSLKQSWNWKKMDEHGSGRENRRPYSSTNRGGGPLRWRVDTKSQCDLHGHLCSKTFDSVVRNNERLAPFGHLPHLSPSSQSV